MKRLKTLSFASCLLLFTQCDTLSQLQTANGSGTTTSSTSSVSSNEAASGIKQALSQGLDRSIKGLAVKDGFLGNAAVKILMPSEAQKIESTLRSIGLG